MIPFVKKGLVWAKTTIEIHAYLMTGSIDDVFQAIFTDLDAHNAQLISHETRIATLETQMPIALAS